VSGPFTNDPNGNDPNANVPNRPNDPNDPNDSYAIAPTRSRIAWSVAEARASGRLLT